MPTAQTALEGRVTGSFPTVLSYFLCRNIDPGEGEEAKPRGDGEDDERLYSASDDETQLLFEMKGMICRLSVGQALLPWTINNIKTFSPRLHSPHFRCFPLPRSFLPLRDVHSGCVWPLLPPWIWRIPRTETR